jgi:hypothetical protein
MASSGPVPHHSGFMELFAERQKTRIFQTLEDHFQAAVKALGGHRLSLKIPICETS